MGLPSLFTLPVRTFLWERNCRRKESLSSPSSLPQAPSLLESLAGPRLSKFLPVSISEFQHLKYIKGATYSPHPTPPHPQRWGKANGLAANTTVRLNGKIDTVVGTTQYSKWTQGGSRFPNAPEMSRANTEEPWAESKPASATAAWLLRQ